MSSSVLIPTLLLWALHWFITQKLWNCVCTKTLILKPDHTICLRLFRFLFRNSIEMARCGPNLLRIIIAHLPKHLFTIYHFKEYRLRQEILLLKQLLLQTTFCNHWRKLQILIFCALTIPLLDGCAGDCRNWNYYCKNSARRLNRLSRRKVNWIAFFNWTLCSLWICSATDHCRWITRIPADERYMLLKYIVWKKCCSSRCGQMWFFGSVRMMNCLPDP